MGLVGIDVDLAIIVGNGLIHVERCKTCKLDVEFCSKGVLKDIYLTTTEFFLMMQGAKLNTETCVPQENCTLGRNYTITILFQNEHQNCIVPPNLHKPQAVPILPQQCDQVCGSSSLKKKTKVPMKIA